MRCKYFINFHILLFFYTTKIINFSTKKIHSLFKIMFFLKKSHIISQKIIIYMCIIIYICIIYIYIIYIRII